ncbi:unnamed protein product, partial [Rotaria magnacalcarata]
PQDDQPLEEINLQEDVSSAEVKSQEDEPPVEVKSQPDEPLEEVKPQKDQSFEGIQFHEVEPSVEVKSEQDQPLKGIKPQQDVPSVEVKHQEDQLLKEIKLQEGEVSVEVESEQDQPSNKIDSHQDQSSEVVGYGIEHPSEDNKHAIELVHQTVDELRQALTDTNSDEQHGEMLSASLTSDIAAPEQVDTDNNDSTSSDASQWLSSSFVTLPEDAKLDTHATEQSIVTQSVSTTVLSERESAKSEILSSSSSIRKKKIKVRSTEQGKHQDAEVISSTVVIEEPKVEFKPTSLIPVKTTTTPVLTKMTPPKSEEKEEENIDDDEGFQVVTYRKHVPSTVTHEKVLPQSPILISKKRSGSDNDRKRAVARRTHGSSIPVATSSTTRPTSQTSATTKQKIYRKETTLSEVPLSSASTDNDITSSSSIDKSRSKDMEQKPLDQPKTSSITTESKSISSTFLITSTAPLLTTEIKSKSLPKNEQTILEYQAPSLIITTVKEPEIKSEPIVPTPTKATATTVRVKAFTSPEEEEEDNEGFRVVHYRKRISSASRSEKTSPALPPQGNRQNMGLSMDHKSVIIHGRHGSGSSSIPRSNAGNQMPYHRRQQIRPKQDRHQFPPTHPPRSSASKEPRITPLFGTETRTVELTKPPVSDICEKMSDVVIQSPSIDQKSPTEILYVQPTIIYEPPGAPSIEHQTILPVVKSKPSDSIQQQVINVEHQAVLATVHPKSSGQDQQEKETEIKVEPLTSKISVPVDQFVQKVVEEYLTPTKVETKRQVQQVAPTKEKILPVIASTIRTKLQKRPSTEDEDEDGFRVVRYRKHVPSSPTATMTTTTTPFSKPHSHSSDSEKNQSRTSRKQISPPSAVAPIGTTSQSMTLKKKTKKTEEKSAAADTTLHADVRSPPTTDTDLVSSSKDEPITRTKTKHIEKVVESQIIIKDVSSPLHSDNQSKSTKEDHKSIQPISLPELVQKTSDDTQYQIQPTESATLPSVASADTSEDSSKKTKKKHKRPKQEPARVDISTTSDEVSSTTDNIPSLKPAVEISSTSSQIEEKSDQVLLKEQTLLSQPTIHIEDGESKIEASKKHPKQRKKKSQSSEKHDQDDNNLTSSAASTADKDSSSATRATSAKPTAIESTIQSRLITDDDKHESEWIVAQSKKKKSKAVESPTTPESSELKLSLYPHSTLQPATTTAKSPPEKVTDVQFKFKKGGELVVTSQVPIEHSPTEWGTVIFLSDEQPNISQKDETTVTTEDTSSQQPSVIEQQPTIEQTIDVISQTDDETKIELSSQAIESSEASGEADLDAYRDQAGRLRRKKPRKHATSLSSKPENVPPPPPPPTTTTNVEPKTSEETKLDHKTTSEHWAIVLDAPISNTDEDEKIQEKPTEDKDNSETSSKLDSFLPEYIRQQIKTESSARSSSLPDHRSKSSSNEPTTPDLHTRTLRAEFPLTSHRSTSPDTSENESRKFVRESHEEENHSTEDSRSLSTSNQIEHGTIITSSSSISSATARKKKQRPKMLKKDIEATTLLTHEFDDTPLTITEIQSASTTTTTQDDESFLSSTTSQSISAITDSLTSSSLSAHKQTPTNEQTSLQSDESVSSIEEPPTSSMITITEPTTTTTTTTVIMRKKSSTRSPRKRSKRDSGPDYENVITPTLDDVEQAFAGARVMTTAVDDDRTDFIRAETHKHQSRQRTSSGRQIINSQEDNEQQAILADDEEDDDFAVKPIVLHGTGVGTNVQTPIESIIEQHDSSATATTTSKKKRQKKKSATEEAEFTAQISDELKSDKDDILVSEEQPAAPNEQLRSVQGFHSFTPNKYQYNQYEEVPTAPTEQIVTSTASTTDTTENKDEVFARGFNLWLKQNKDNESSSTVKKDEKEEPSQQQPEVVSGLTRAMQSLIIQPVESDNDDEEEDDEDDSWNGPRAKKPTYTTGARAEKRIHTSSGYNVNHPRSVAISPWLMPKSNDNTYQDDSSKYDPNDSSKYDPDDEEDSINDASDRLQLSHSINTQFSTKEERQIHLNSLAELTFQATTNTLSSSASSSLSSAVKWNETSIRTDETVQLQTNFTDDDVRRCLGEDFYRESLAVDPLHAEKRALASLRDLVLKPTQQLEETDNDDDDIDDDSQNNENNKNNNNNNNNTSNNFDEWGHFLDYDDEQNIILPSEPTSSRIQPCTLTSYECSYVRELDDDTLVTDADRSHLIDYTQHSYEHERQRYGDFACTNDDSDAAESMVNLSSILTNSNTPRPSETFHRWRNQSNRDRDESNSRVTISTENQNDDEIFVSHTDSGLSRRVRPTQ